MFGDERLAQNFWAKASLSKVMQISLIVVIECLMRKIVE